MQAHDRGNRCHDSELVACRLMSGCNASVRHVATQSSPTTLLRQGSSPIDETTLQAPPVSEPGSSAGLPRTSATTSASSSCNRPQPSTTSLSAYCLQMDILVAMPVAKKDENVPRNTKFTFGEMAGIGRNCSKAPCRVHRLDDTGGHGCLQ